MPGWFKKLFGGSSGVPPTPKDSSAGGVYSGLRAQALSIQRSAAGIPSPPADAPVWGVLMETTYPSGTATLFALADGTTSLYFSTGGGVIGGQGHESVRQANTALLATANQFRQHLQRASSFPVPEVDHTLFYLLTDGGVLTGGGRVEALGYGRDILSPLFHAGDGVLTQLRLVSGG